MKMYSILLLVHSLLDPDCIFEVDGIGRTALMYAVNFSHLDTVQILLENGIEVNATAHGKSRFYSILLGFC